MRANVPGLQGGPSATSPPAPQPLPRHHAPSKQQQKLPPLAEEEVVDTEINKEILRAAAKRPAGYKSAQPRGNSLRKRPNNQVCFLSALLLNPDPFLDNSSTRPLSSFSSKDCFPFSGSFLLCRLQAWAKLSSSEIWDCLRPCPTQPRVFRGRN